LHGIGAVFPAPGLIGVRGNGFGNGNGKSGQDRQQRGLGLLIELQRLSLRKDYETDS
jgi:hypothetical protein